MCQWSWSTLVQVMACCLMSPSHNLNQYWTIITPKLKFKYSQSVKLFWKSHQHFWQCQWVTNICRDGPRITYSLFLLQGLTLIVAQFNTLIPGQSGQHLVDNIYKCIFFDENYDILIKISPKLVPEIWTDNNSAMVHVMAWHQTGSKPIPESKLIWDAWCHMASVSRNQFILAIIVCGHVKCILWRDDKNLWSGATKIIGRIVKNGCKIATEWNCSIIVWYILEILTEIESDFFIHILAAIAHLTHWGRVTHICIGKLTIIGSDNGLSPGRRQAIIWTNVGILLIGPLGTNFSEILIEILTFSFKKMHLKVSSAKRRPFCLGLHVATLENDCHSWYGANLECI